MSACLRLRSLLHFALITTILLTVTFTAFQVTYAQDPQFCYLMSDHFTGQSNNAPDYLTILDFASGQETGIGFTGSTDVESLAFNPLEGQGVLYGASGNRLGVIDVNTGVFTQRPNTFGSGNGPASDQPIPFNDIDGIAFHPITGELYGTLRINNGGSQFSDIIFQIDPETGQAVPGAFNGDDYIGVPEIEVNGVVYDDVDDIFISPINGRLYILMNTNGVGGALVEFNLRTGEERVVGVLGIDDMEGATVFNSGRAFGTTGDMAGSASNSFYRINQSTGDATLLFQLGLTVDGVDGQSSDYEGVACLTGFPPNEIRGGVCHDLNDNGQFDGGETGTENVTVLLYRDNNSNGQFDSSDVLLDEVETDGSGNYEFVVAATGDFVVVIDPDDLPAGHELTGVNLHTASFDDDEFGSSDDNNDFCHAADITDTPTPTPTPTDEPDDPDDPDDPDEPDEPGEAVVTQVAQAVAPTVDPLAGITRLPETGLSRWNALRLPFFGVMFLLGSGLAVLLLRRKKSDKE